LNNASGDACETHRQLVCLTGDDREGLKQLALGNFQTS
jgi:hypothetical protein